MAEKPKKPQKLRARLPRGLADRGPAEIAATRAMVTKIREVYERYGFEPVETPAMEYTDALGKFLPDQDRPNEGVFSFQDDDEQWISLRYDLTAPLARYVAENFDSLPKPYRSYREGYVYRNEKPGPGRFRQFMQFDADTVGSASPAADAEMCMMAADTMEALEIPRGSYVVKVNNRKILDGVLNAIGIGGDENADVRLTVLRAIDKLDRLGIQGVRDLLGAGRRDESGDFTKGAGLDEEGILRIWKSYQFFKRDWKKPFSIRVYKRHLKRFVEFNYPADLIDRGLEELDEIRKLVRAAGYETDQIHIDPSVVRGLEYYTGPVYEVELTLETKDEKGRPVRFGSVGGGGR
ncbi:MAG: HisS family protein, partial [Bradyrhizobium sp.]|nr:HisS family protein [Bradyrhizobium sp.]